MATTKRTKQVAEEATGALRVINVRLTQDEYDLVERLQAQRQAAMPPRTKLWLGSMVAEIVVSAAKGEVVR